MDWFNGMTTDQIRAKYAELVKQYHPSIVAMRGGDEREQEEAAFISGEINEQYQIAIAQAHKVEKPKATAGEAMVAAETDEDIRTVLTRLVAIPGIAIEVCGTWIWISGCTKEVKEEIKAAAPNRMNWSPKKMMWYWKPSGGRSRGHGWSMDKVRAAHGSFAITRDTLEG